MGPRLLGAAFGGFLAAWMIPHFGWRSVLLLGGAAMDGPRHLFWNFVSSSRERIEQAKADWQAGRFGKVPGDEKEFIPLPERKSVRAGSRLSEPGRVSDGSPTS